MSAVSWPLLIAWGLPISYMSIIGNILFSPFIFLFLLLCTLFFIAYLLNLPTTLLVIALEKVTHVWLTLLNSASHLTTYFPWCLSVRQVYIPTATSAALITLLLLSPRRYELRTKNRHTLFMFLLITSIISWVAGFWYPAPQKIIIARSYNTKKRLVLTQAAGILTVKNNRYYRQKSATETMYYKLVRYTLAPAIRKNFGQVDTLVCDDKKLKKLLEKAHLIK